VKGGALFDYDKAGPARMLWMICRNSAPMLRNPQATFRIEGHTDSKGRREYN
jgi:outer membrane protein OmpA-like peptidoglycan-associated protein